MYVYVKAGEARNFNFAWFVKILKTIESRFLGLIMVPILFSDGDDESLSSCLSDKGGLHLVQAFLDGITSDNSLQDLDQFLSDAPFQRSRELAFGIEWPPCPYGSEVNKLFKKTVKSKMPKLANRVYVLSIYRLTVCVYAHQVYLLLHAWRFPEEPTYD